MKRLSYLLLVASQLTGEVMYNNIGTGAYGVEQRVDRQLECAVALKPYTTFTLTSIALPLSVANAPGSITVALTADADGAPGRTVESFAITNIASTKPVIYTVNSTQHPVLESYTQYWIVVNSTNASRITWFNTLDSGFSHARLEAHRRNVEPWSVIADPYVPGVIVSGHAATGRNLALK